MSNSNKNKVNKKVYSPNKCKKIPTLIYFCGYFTLYGRVVTLVLFFRGFRSKCLKQTNILSSEKCFYFSCMDRRKRFSTSWVQMRSMPLSRMCLCNAATFLLFGGALLMHKGEKEQLFPVNRVTQTCIFRRKWQ